MTTLPKKQGPGRPRGTPNPNGGRRRTLPGKKRQLTLRIEPDLYAWLKSLPRGETERILRLAEINSRIL